MAASNAMVLIEVVFEMAAFSMVLWLGGWRPGGELPSAGVVAAASGAVVDSQLFERAEALMRQHVLGGVGKLLQAIQPEKAAGALDGVHEAEDVIEDLGVVRLLLEANQLIVDGVQAFARFRQKLTQQIIHENRPSYREGAHDLCCAISEWGQLHRKAFNNG